LALERRYRLMMGVAALALVVALPGAVHAWVAFGPTTPATFTEAQDILVNVRIPHHTQPKLWLDPVAGVQTAWMVLGAALAWRTRLFALVAIPLLLAAVLTAIQVATGSHSLALLFPWRVSAVLMPLATAAVLARLAPANAR